MEITLEKIELVKDRTGVSYKEAKDALEACDGSVVDAIISIEEKVDIGKSGKTSEFIQDTTEKIRELVKKGNVSKITVKKDDEILLNIPLNVGILGAVVAPWGVVAAALASFGFKCKVEVVTDDGKIINVSEKVDNAAEHVKAKGAGVVDEVKEKAPGVWEDIKEKGSDAFAQAKEKGSDILEQVKEKTPDTWEDVRGMAQERFNQFKNRSNSGDLLDDLDLDDIVFDDEEEEK